MARKDPQTGIWWTTGDDEGQAYWNPTAKLWIYVEGPNKGKVSEGGAKGKPRDATDADPGGVKATTSAIQAGRHNVPRSGATNANTNAERPTSWDTYADKYAYYQSQGGTVDYGTWAKQGYPGWPGDEDAPTGDDGGGGGDDGGDGNADPGGGSVSAAGGGATSALLSPLANPETFTGSPGAGFSGLPVDSANWQQWTQEPGDSYLSNDYAGSFNEWWNRVNAQLVNDFYKGTWSGDIRGPGFKRPIPTGYYGIARDADEFVIDSPAVVEYVSDYVKWLLTSGNIQKSAVRDTFGLPGDPGELRSANFSQDPEGDERNEVLNSAYFAWIEEGDKGVQAYVQTLRQEGRLDKLELNMLLSAQQTTNNAKKQRQDYELAVTRLAQDVAQYSADLASRPVDWVRRGLWLRDRGAVVNGLTLALAEINVPVEQFEQTNSPFPISRYSVEGKHPGAEEQVQAAAKGGAGSSPMTTPTTQPVTAPTSSASGTDLAPQADDPHQQTVLGAAGVFARNLSEQYDPSAYQARTDQLQYGQGQEPGVLPQRRNALDLNVGEAYGHEVNAQKYSRASATDRQQKDALVQSVGRDPGTFRQEVEDYRPKGRSRGPLDLG